MRAAIGTTLVLLVMQQSALRIPPSGAQNPDCGPRKADCTVWDSVYTAEQATRGQAEYSVQCWACHGAMLDGMDAAPALTGGAFRARWDGVNLGDMVERIRGSMPLDKPGTLSRQQVVDVLAYLLSVNGMPAGNAELPRDVAALRQILFMATSP